MSQSEWLTVQEILSRYNRLEQGWNVVDMNIVSTLYLKLNKEDIINLRQLNRHWCKCINYMHTSLNLHFIDLNQEVPQSRELLTYLFKIKNAKSVTLRGVCFHLLTDYKYFSQLKQIENFELLTPEGYGSSNFSRPSYEHISALTRLTSLSIELIYDRIIDLQYMSNLKNLNFLALRMGKIKEKSLDCVSLLKNLYKIEFESMKLSGHDFENMAKLSSLQSLCLSHIKSESPDNFSRICHMTKLTNLTIIHCGIQKIDNLRNLSNLSNLNISGNCEFEISTDIKYLRQLHELNLCRVKMTEDKMRNIAQLENLKMLTLGSMNACGGNANWQILGTMTWLTQLIAYKHWEGEVNQPQQELMLQRIHNLNNLMKLKSLHLGSGPFFQHLRVLSINHIPNTFMNLNELTHLNVSGSRLDDERICAIINLICLKVLDASANLITDMGFGLICNNLLNIENLDVMYNDITYNGTQLKNSLKYLKVFWCDFDEDGNELD